MRAIEDSARESQRFVIGNRWSARRGWRHKRRSANRTLCFASADNRATVAADSRTLQFRVVEWGVRQKSLRNKRDALIAERHHAQTISKVESFWQVVIPLSRAD